MTRISPYEGWMRIREGVAGDEVLVERLARLVRHVYHRYEENLEGIERIGNGGTHQVFRVHAGQTREGLPSYHAIRLYAPQGMGALPYIIDRSETLEQTLEGAIVSELNGFENAHRRRENVPSYIGIFAWIDPLLLEGTELSCGFIMEDLTQGGKANLHTIPEFMNERVFRDTDRTVFFIDPNGERIGSGDAGVKYLLEDARLVIPSKVLKIPRNTSSGRIKWVGLNDK